MLLSVFTDGHLSRCPLGWKGSFRFDIVAANACIRFNALFGISLNFRFARFRFRSGLCGEKFIDEFMRTSYERKISMKRCINHFLFGEK